MANSPGSDLDDDFANLYKEYTGPMGSNTVVVHEQEKPSKRSQPSSDDEEEARDPNAVPTDFTSREAKVWEAKSKATERNWKKRKEEEMICKICGESGHFTQGCPSTLGANRKSQDFFERVPAREPHVKALFTEKVIQKIEKDIGCKIKVEEKFIIVSGRDRLVLSKGVDAVHKVKEEGEKRGSSSYMSRSRSPERKRSPPSSRFGRSESLRSYSSPRDSSQLQPRISRPDKIMEDRVRDDLRKLSRGSPQAYANEGARGRSSHSRSPARLPYASNSYNSYDGRSQSIGDYKNDGWDNTERRGSNVQTGHKYEQHAFSQTVEDLQSEYKRDAMELGRIRDKEEDEENYNHREAVREMRENYSKKLAILRGNHAKQWEEFLLVNAQRRQVQANQQISNSGFSGGYSSRQSNYHTEYDSSRRDGDHFGGASSIPAEDSRGRYSHPMDNYASSRPHPRDNYGDLQQQRRESFEKTYNKY